ncbi:hypothetical protein DDQ41_21890 [Streptomyces spongiicola]|uniref:LPXTG cell wall anchor domain-containing protein n=1 Tax=Streptomyces spongiicola TaxID=1690221 RepID=A0ABM6VB33_9ACTN|nr:hypothetical protein [Streptomyces spongiicola]AWK11126.1 hypothetical protein DDQ41_21890 [Streptomyces spongiicola]
MSVALRPLLTAAAAGSLLCALWFVPSANATADGEYGQPDQSRSGASASGVEDGERAETAEDEESAEDGESAEGGEGGQGSESGGGGGGGEDAGGGEGGRGREDGARDAGAAGGSPAVSPSGVAGDVPAADGAPTGAGEPRGEEQGLALADTGSVDTTPYLVGGTLFLVVGAGFVSHASRRSGSRPV